MVAEVARPVGLFDSGVGGLTVARSVIDVLPHEDLIYFGDTARCPYGPRDAEEVRKFALEITDALVGEGVKMLVVACNSAASVALADARSRYEIPVLGVIEPGLRAALAATRNRRIGLIGTKATVDSGSYELSLAATRVNASLHAQACPRFVEFVERGDTTSDELVAVAESYLAPLREREVDTLILGCTHYPLLMGVIQHVMGERVVLVSSAEATASEVYSTLLTGDLLNPSRAPALHRFVASSRAGITTDLGARFLGPEFRDVEYRPWDRS